MILVLCLVSTLLLACGSKAGLAEYRTATVQRGNLTTDITGVSNLALSHTVDLAFEGDGTVEEVLVAVGDSVEEGQVLAKLDSTAWEDYITGLEDKVTAAEDVVTTKEDAVTAAESKILTRQIELVQAQINLQTAEDNTNKVQQVADANKAVDDAEYDLSIAQAMWQQAMLSEMTTTEANFWTTQINLANKNLADAKKELADIKAGTSVKVSNNVTALLQIQLGELQVEQAQSAVDDAQKALDDAPKTVDDAQKAVDTAQKALGTAQKNLADAQSASPEVTAPFAGFITAVNYKGGDVVKKGAVAVTLADPNKFEANIQVNEHSISQIKLGGNAAVTVDAIPGITLAANLTRISPTATTQSLQSGVVNYQVTVEIQSLQPVTQAQQWASANATSANISSSQFPNRSGHTAISGNLTQEQIQAMINQRQQSSTQPLTGQPPQALTTAPQNIQLRQGMTVTVSIIVQEGNNVLLVPNQAITLQQGQDYVQVLAADNSTEQRAIQTGINNSLYTEVTSGLTEGEKVIVPQATATSSTTSSATQQRGGGMIGIPAVIGRGGD